jgi:hypothetical protein
VANISSNLVADISSEIASQVGNLLPLRKPSRYQWSLNDNSFKGNSAIFAVRPGSASTTSGTNRTVTFDQNFEVILSDSFKNKGDNDAALDAAIKGIYEDMQTIYVEIFQRKLNLSRVLLIDSMEMSEAEVDNENDIVNITLRFNVKYRTEI